jgi:hypothetical protein
VALPALSVVVIFGVAVVLSCAVAVTVVSGTFDSTRTVTV